jgi:hypothetical protein
MHLPKGGTYGRGPPDLVGPGRPHTLTPPPRVRPDLNRVRRVETTQGSAIRFLSFLEISDGCDACYGER